MASLREGAGLVVRTTVSTFPARSKYCSALEEHCRTAAPCSSDEKSPPGVATPRAHGQDITTTETNTSTEKSRPMWPR